MNDSPETYHSVVPVEDLSLPATDTSRRPKRFAIGVLVIGLALIVTFAVLAQSGRGAGSSVQGVELVATAEGVVSQILVREGQTVAAGEILVAFDDQAEQAELVAAQQALQELAASVNTSEVAVAVTPPEGVTGRIVAIGPLPAGPPPGSKPLPVLPAPKGTAQAQLPAVHSEGTTPTEPKANLEGAVAELETKISETKNEVVSLEHRISTAKTEAEDATKNAEAAKVIAQQRKQQADKMRMLLGEGAVSQLETSRAEVQYASAQGGYEAALKMAEEANARVSTLEVDLAKQQKALPDLEKTLKITLDALKNAPKPTPSVSVPPISETPVRTEPAPRSVPKPAFVQPAPLPNTPTKVDVDKGAIREADQLLSGAKERVDKAEAAIMLRRFNSTRAGKVVRILVKPGDRVKPGQVIAVIQ